MTYRKENVEFSTEQQHKREEGLLNRRNQEAQFAKKKKKIEKDLRLRKKQAWEECSSSRGKGRKGTRYEKMGMRKDIKGQSG